MFGLGINVAQSRPIPDDIPVYSTSPSKESKLNFKLITEESFYVVIIYSSMIFITLNEDFFPC
jgi:hypothetical protein